MQTRNSWLSLPVTRSPGAVWADSVGLERPIYHSARITPVSASSAVYEITVHGSPSGIAYEVAAAVEFGSSGRHYRFAPRLTEPAICDPDRPEITAHLEDFHFQECAGMLRVSWADTDGALTTVQGGYVRAGRDPLPGTEGVSTNQALWHIPPNATQLFVPVREDDDRTEIYVRFDFSAPGHASGCLEDSLVIPCDGIADVSCTVDPTTLGGIVGRFDVVGEHEHATRIAAVGGRCFLDYVDWLSGTPASGAFELERLYPSAVTDPLTGYRVYAQTSFRRGRRFESLKTPELGSAERDRVMVPPGETVDIGDAFVITPGFLVGDILLAGPPTPGGEWPAGPNLEDVWCDPVDDGDGVPLDVFSLGSYVEAFGVAGGRASALFEGEYDAARNSFEGDYELVLGGLNGQDWGWAADVLLHLEFRDGHAVADGDSSPSSVLNINNGHSAVVDIAPGETVEAPRHYCFSRVLVECCTVSGTFFSPGIRWSEGSFTGVDFEGREAHYTTNIEATGTPTHEAEAADRGLVVLWLPAGRYALKPYVTFVNPDGPNSETGLPLSSSATSRKAIVSPTAPA